MGFYSEKLDNVIEMSIAGQYVLIAKNRRINRFSFCVIYLYNGWWSVIQKLGVVELMSAILFAV